MLRQQNIAASGKKEHSRNYRQNGQISTDVRLACALRWFAGGSLYDIMTTYGIGHTDAIDSCWYVVDAINSHPYPEEHDKQQSIAEGFRQVSGAIFACCAGAIDGILIWIHKPSERDSAKSGCSSGKFMCTRKKKFGLNCQAVSDVRGRILDISIMYPRSTSDCLAFEGMNLFQKLESGMLAQGCAYLATMLTT
ncbi:nuclease [Fragilaria crotonensis]|nr:nuclease [Fragilaria crotonensis]